MNSEVRLKDLDSGELKAYTPVFSSQTRTENSATVLAARYSNAGKQVGDVIDGLDGWKLSK